MLGISETGYLAIQMWRLNMLEKQAVISPENTPPEKTNQKPSQKNPKASELEKVAKLEEHATKRLAEAAQKK